MQGDEAVLTEQAVPIYEVHHLLLVTNDFSSYCVDIILILTLQEHLLVSQTQPQATHLLALMKPRQFTALQCNIS